MCPSFARWLLTMSRFRPNASWNANLTILNSIRQFGTLNGALKFSELAMKPPMLLGRNLFENSNMDDMFDAAATAANHVLLVGAFQQFVITHRIGSRVELIPNLAGADQRPTWQRGAFLWARVGSNVMTSAAFRVLNVATTA